MPSLGKVVVFWLFLSLFGLSLSVLFIEVILRLLPVSDATYRLPVNEENPILRLEPNREFIWSKSWRFEMVNRVKTNNFGFLNESDYDNTSSKPLIAIIGDSYVEAIMVPFKETVSGRLSAHVASTARVYSFGISGAALSQYLAYSEFVKKAFNPKGIVIIVAGNDFDESLKKYNSAPGYHYFIEGSNGRLSLQRMDYHPSWVKKLIRRFALGRYLGINLELQGRLNQIGNLVTEEEKYALFVGNTYSNSDPIRIEDSKGVVDAFYDELPFRSGLSPGEILLVIDGIRPHLYDPQKLNLAKGSYFDVMRNYFIKSGVSRGYELIDMQSIFIKHYRKSGKRFEYQEDGHWNSLGHQLVFIGISQSKFMERFNSLP